MHIQSSFNRPARLSKGFTLIELLVVIFILAILVALLLPAIQVVRSTSYKVHCSNNLHNMGIAYHTFLDSRNGNASKFNSRSWRESIKEAAEKTEHLFVCISDASENGSGDAQSDATLPDAKIFVRESIFVDTYQLSIPFALDGSRMQVSSRTPATPPSYALEVEAAGVGRGGTVSYDWNDLVIRVDPDLKDGSITVTAVLAISSPYSFDLYDSNGQLLVYDFGPNSNNTYKFQTAAAEAGPSNSYGCNSIVEAYSVTEDGGKVLICEYKKSVINVVNTRIGNRSYFGTDLFTQFCAARHSGYLNVLFVRGDVQDMEPTTLNPRNRLTQNEYWRPNSNQAIAGENVGAPPP
jgi:prepilin-type N-terminal cleavage/methylation domain-containing protein